MTKAVSSFAFLALLALAACGRVDGTYPSLGVRPAEAKGFAEPVSPAPMPVAADPVLEARVAEMRRSLAAIGSGFDRDAATARTAAGRAGVGTVGSDAWLAAQTSLAELDNWRAQASAAVVDADSLASTRAASLQQDYPALEALRAASAAEVARQDAAICQLAARLPLVR